MDASGHPVGTQREPQQAAIQTCQKNHGRVSPPMIRYFALFECRRSAVQRN
jgi:hypothetical protein